MESRRKNKKRAFIIKRGGSGPRQGSHSPTNKESLKIRKNYSPNITRRKGSDCEFFSKRISKLIAECNRSCSPSPPSLKIPYVKSKVVYKLRTRYESDAEPYIDKLRAGKPSIRKHFEILDNNRNKNYFN